jgi:hypothetical protein
MNKIFEYKNKCNKKTHIIIEQIETISNEIIDSSRSKIFESGKFIYFEYYRIDDKSYPFRFEVGTEEEKDKYSLSFGNDSNLITEIYYENISDEELLKYTYDLFYNFLHSNIQLKETIWKNIIVRAEITVEKLISSDGFRYNFGRRNRPLFFWQKPKFKITNYIPWIK